MDSTTAWEILQRNHKFLCYTVNSFMRRCPSRYQGGVISREDLMQEVTLCFLSEVEKYGEETARRNRLSLLQSMYQAVMTAYPLSVPKRSSGFRKITERHLWVDRWEDMAERIKIKDYSENMVERITITQQMEALSDTDKKIIHWRLEGLTQREIANRMGLTDVQMCRRMKRIKAIMTQ